MSDQHIDATLAATLDSLDGAQNYRDWIFSMARPHLEGPILEVGAGTGTFTSLLADVGDVTAVEPTDVLFDALVANHGSDARIGLVHGTVDALPDEEQFAAAVMFNVLEHIPDDGQALEAIYRRLLPGGNLVLWVPAFPMLYGRFDEMLGHCRRYRIGPLRRLLTASGYTVVNERYMNSVGWFAWLVVARWLGMVPSSAGTVSLYDRLVVPVVRAVEEVVRPPFGQSIVAVARKPLRS